MAHQDKIETTQEVGHPAWPTFGVLGSLALGVTTLCAVGLLLLMVTSLALNVYLGWELSGLEIAVVTRAPATPNIIVVTPVVATHTPPASSAGAAAADTPTAPSVASAPTVLTVPPNATQTPTPPATASATPVATSTNTYALIPLDGDFNRSAPAADNPDLNIKLRDPQLSKTGLTLVDIPGPDDPDAPQLSALFDPADFIATYTIHRWDQGCNCTGALIEDEQTVLLGLKTTPGQPLYIPPRQQDIYQGQYYAVVLYASEDSLTFMYHRGGSIDTGYAIHYLGLQTDPNLLDLYQTSRENNLPGLTLNVPVGLATDELIVAVRSDGSFMDARSRKDWWE